MNYTILIVDDDMAINDMLVKYLRKNGYITYSAYSGTEALLFLEKQKVNLIILDLMLPGLSGEQVLAEIKKTKNVPVIGLSAKEDSKSKISLLKNGADDYVTKPFDIEELLARIETILRRIYENQYTSNSLLCCGDLNLDTIGMEATLKNQKLPLTKNEFAILKMLMEHKGIGKKVANCISLFGLHHLDACPIDVWMKKIIDEEYDGVKPAWMSDRYAGVYQQYAFFYKRDRK